MRDFHFPGRSAVFATNGMCATSHPLAAKVAVEILQSGGNAMDAAIAGAVLLGMCEPQMTGIGGDCFALFKPAGSDEVKALNGSGRAPAAASAEALRAAGHETVPIHAPEAVTIPTAVDAFCRLNSDWGRLGLDAILAPAIRYTEEGVPVAPRVAFDWPVAGQALSGHGLHHYMFDGQAGKGRDKCSVRRGKPRCCAGLRKTGATPFIPGKWPTICWPNCSARGGVHEAGGFCGR